MAEFIIHIGAPRTGTTVLQKHLFPRCVNTKIFSKAPFKESGIMMNKSKSIGGSDIKTLRRYYEKVKSSSQLDNYEFAQKLIFTPIFYTAHNPPKGDFNTLVSDSIKLLSSLYEDSQRILISSERLCDTASSLVCRSFHSNFEWRYPVFPLCELISLATGHIPKVVVTLREPISYLKSKYLRTILQRKAMGERFLSASEYIDKQVTLENKHPGTSALTPALHADFIKQLENKSKVKAFGFQELINSKDIFSLMGIKEERKYSFKQFPAENTLPFDREYEENVTRKIIKTLRINNLYERILTSQLFS